MSESTRQAVQAGAPRLLTRGFGAVLMAQGCFGYAFSSFFMLPKFLVTELGAGPADIGGVASVHGLSVVLSMPLMGTVVDRFGRRRFLTLGALLMAVTSIAFAAVEEVGPLLYSLRALHGLAFAMAFASGAALAVDHAPPERLGQAIGIFGLAFLSMNAIAATAVESLAAGPGWSTAFACAGGGALACALLSLRIREPRRAPGRQEDVAGLWEVARRPRQLRAYVAVALVGAAISAMFAFHQPFALELGMTEVRSFLVAYAVAAIAVRLGMGSLIDRFGHRRTSIAALVPYAGVVAGMAALRPGGLACFGAGLGIAHGLFYPAFNAVALDGAGVHDRGKVMALFQAAFQIGTASGALALGAVAERAGYPAAFLAGGGCALAALLLIVLAREPSGAELPRSPG
jgi:predicted MFS family arabinose efflux permease